MAQIVDFLKTKYGTDYAKKPEKTGKSEKAERRVQAEQREAEGRSEHYKKKLIRHRLTIFYKILIGIAVLAMIGGVVYFSRKRQVYTDYDTLRRVDFDAVYTANYRSLNGIVLRYSKDGASAFNMENSMIWNQTYEMQNPMIDSCGDYAAIGDYKGTKIYVFNSEGMQGQIDTTLPMQKFCVSGNGNVAAVLEENEVTWIKLFNKAGQLVANDRTTMAKSGYPVRVAISNNGILLGISFLRIDTGVLSSSVAFYNFGAVGQNEIDNLVSGYDFPETVVSDVEFMNDKTAFAVGDNKMILFEGAQKPEQKAAVPIEGEIRSVYYGQNYIGLIFQDETGEAQYRMDVYDTEGKLAQSFYFSLDYQSVLFHKDTVMIYNSDECLLYNMQGVEKFHGSFHRSILTVAPTAGPFRYLLVTGNEMEEIQLK